MAVSGGADSVALLCLLYRLSSSLGLTLAVAHLNHRIRGKESDDDAEFVKKLASRFGISCVIGNIDVPKIAKNSSLSLEMAARKARYDFLVKTAYKLRANVIATAHTADDQAETILLKLARGAGARGLAGIPRELFLDDLKVVRPMLDIRRSEIEAFLQELNQTWREDKTNRNPAYLRNRVRHEVLPFLEKKLNPEIRIALLRASEVLREEDKWLEELATGILKKCLINSGKILNVKLINRQCIAARRRVLRLWLSSSGISPEILDYNVVARVEALLRGAKGSGKTEIAGNWIVKRRYGRLVVEKRCTGSSRSFRHEVQIPGETVVADIKLKIVTSLRPGLVKDSIIQAGHLPARASINLSAVGKRKLIVRSWWKGDRIKPFGMAGSKKLQDVFTDEKIPVEQRGDVPVFECGGEIIWIPGYRVARGWEIKIPSGPALQILIEKLVLNSSA